MTTHTPDCGGESAPWCSAACVEANVLVDAKVAALALGITPSALRGLVRRGRITAAAHAPRDRGRPALLFSRADLDAYDEARHETPEARSA